MFKLLEALIKMLARYMYSLGVMMYSCIIFPKYQYLISSTDTSTNLADVLAPILKLCVLYLWWSSYGAARIAEKDVLKNCLVSGILLSATYEKQTRFTTP